MLLISIVVITYKLITL